MLRPATLALIGLLMTPAYAGQEGNGGDAYAIEFKALAIGIAARIEQEPRIGVSGQALLEAIEKTEVTSKDELTLDGRPVDAINYPDPEKPRIVLSRKGFDRLRENSADKGVLILHEYLGILGIADERYQQSSFLRWIGICGRSPEIRAAIEQKLEEGCLTIDSGDLLRVRGGIQINKPETLQLGDFEGLANLEQLHFNGPVTGPFYNHVPGLFAGLTKLEHLQSFGSRAAKIDSGAFAGIFANPASPSLYFRLLLAPNPVLAAGAFMNPHVTTIHLLGSHGLVLKTEQFLGAPRLKDLSVILDKIDDSAPEMPNLEMLDGALDGLKLTSLALKVGKGSRITPESFRGIKLKKLDLTTNAIPNQLNPKLFSLIDGLESLALDTDTSYGGLYGYYKAAPRGLDAGFFDNLKLKSIDLLLDLSRVSLDTWTPLTKTLQEMKLRAIEWENLPRGFFTVFQELEKVRLSAPQIKHPIPARIKEELKANFICHERYREFICVK